MSDSDQTAVDVEELELRVDALSKGLAAARESDEELELRVDTLSKGLAAVRESIDEQKDDLEAERQERRRLREENERLDARTNLLKLVDNSDDMTGQ